jgi:rhomboid domain-containing protein 1
MGSLNAAAAKLGLGTTAICALLLAAALFQFMCLDAASTRRFTVSAATVADGQVYRIVTSSFLHGGLLHFGMNLASTTAIGSALERTAGTVRLLAITAWAVPLAGVISCALSLALAFATRDEALARQHALGFSGVIFALAPCEAARGGGRRSVFGLVEVPARLYPWALLVAMQVIVPHVSFVGHLGGLVVGSLEVTGWLAVALPSANAVAAVDARCARLPGYAPAGDAFEVRAASGAGDILSVARHAAGFVVKLAGLGGAASAARQRASLCLRGGRQSPPPAPAGVSVEV